MLKRSAAVMACLMVVAFSLGADQRSYTAGKFGVVIDGAPLGFIKSLSGGNIVGDVVVEPVGANQFPGKHLAAVRCEDIVIETRVDLLPVQQMIQSALQGNQKGHTGSIYHADFNFNVVTEL